MCGSKPKMPPAAPPAPPPIPDPTPGAVAPILGNQQAQLRRFDALRELSKLVIPVGDVRSVRPSDAAPDAPVAPKPPFTGYDISTSTRPARGAAATPSPSSTSRSSGYGNNNNRR